MRRVIVSKKLSKQTGVQQKILSAQAIHGTAMRIAHHCSLVFQMTTTCLLALASRHTSDNIYAPEHALESSFAAGV
jgi:hypothetical protein